MRVSGSPGARVQGGPGGPNGDWCPPTSTPGAQTVLPAPPPHTHTYPVPPSVSPSSQRG